jgi:hypothetical protein
MQTKQPKPAGSHYAVKSPTRGGARPNAGRKPGSTTKITVESLMAEIELHAGKTYAEVLAHNYVGAISRSDWNGVRDYDKAFMNKLIAERLEVDVTSTEDAIAARQTAFAAALARLNEVAQAAK